MCRILLVFGGTCETVANMRNIVLHLVYSVFRSLDQIVRVVSDSWNISSLSGTVSYIGTVSSVFSKYFI